MKKLNALIIASMTGLALAGGFFFAGTASAADYRHPPEMQQDNGRPQVLSVKFYSVGEFFQKQ